MFQFQFRLRTLLFLTSIIALWGAMARISIVLGCAALLPMTVALHHTFRSVDPDRPRFSWLYLLSLILIAALAIVTIARLLVSAASCLLNIALVAAEATRWTMQQLSQMLRSQPVMRAVALARGTSFCLAAVLSMVRRVVTYTSAWLAVHHRGLRSAWSHPVRA